jgi:uncharacterized membrane protein YhaH (DUF805 family)
MDFGTAVSTCFHKYADFEGRARRSEYWYFVLFNVLVMAALAVVGAIIGGTLGGAGTIVNTILVLFALFWLGMILPHLAVQVRRFHDLGVTGWFVLIFAVLSLIPIFGYLASIGEMIWFCMRGTDGDNNYGPDPYDPDPAEVFS